MCVDGESGGETTPPNQKFPSSPSSSIRDCWTCRHPQLTGPSAQQCMTGGPRSAPHLLHWDSAALSQQIAHELAVLRVHLAGMEHWLFPVLIPFTQKVGMLGNPSGFHGQIQGSALLFPSPPTPYTLPWPALLFFLQAIQPSAPQYEFS